MINKIFYSIFLIIACPLFLMSQEDLPVQDIQVEKQKEIEVQEANAIKTKSALPDLPKTSRNYSYDMSADPIELSYPSPYIRPVAMVPDLQASVYNGFVDARVGTLGHISGEAAYNIHAQDYYNLGLELDYIRFDDSSIENKKYSLGNGEVELDYYLNNRTELNASLSYGEEGIHFFGFNELDSLGTGNESRKIRDFDATFGVSYHLDKEELTTVEGRLGIGFLNVVPDSSSRQNLVENNLIIEGKLSRIVSKNISAYLLMGMDLTNTDRETTFELNHNYLEPSATILLGGSRLDLGTRIVETKDEIGFFPKLRLTTNVASGRITPYVGMSGDYFKNDLESLMEINPFFDDVDETNYTNRKEYDFHAGFHSTSNVGELSAQLGYRITDNYALFLNSFGDNRRKFVTTLDDMNIYYASLALDFKYLEAIDFGGTLIKSFFDNALQEKAWHVPSLEVSIYGSVDLIKDKLNIRSDLYVKDPVAYLSEAGNAEKSNAQLDLNFKIFYSIIDRISLQLRANNLLSSNYERWHGYHTFGAHYDIGLRVKI